MENCYGTEGSRASLSVAGRKEYFDHYKIEYFREYLSKIRKAEKSVLASGQESTIGYFLQLFEQQKNIAICKT